MSEIRIPTLEPDDIEVKVKQVTQKGAVALLYKTARTDMRILDEVFGINGWSVDYERIGDALFCTISVWDDEKKQWIKKQNCGIESREDGEGNEKKGEASDAMKRAGFLIGIGRELYSSPFVFIRRETEKDDRGKWKLKDPFEKFSVTDIKYDNKRKISKLVIVSNTSGEVVYKYGASEAQKPEPKAPAKVSAKSALEKAGTGLAKMSKTVPPTPAEQPATQPTEPPATPKATISQDTQEEVNNFMKRHKIKRDEFIAMRAKAVKDGKNITAKKFDQLTSDEYMMLLAEMELLYQEGYFQESA